MRETTFHHVLAELAERDCAGIKLSDSLLSLMTIQKLVVNFCYFKYNRSHSIGE